MSTDEPIEQYLDALYVELRTDPRTDPRSARRLLDEAADHLHGAAAELEATGMDRLEAEREAVRRFGPGGPLARADGARSARCSSTRRPRPPFSARSDSSRSG